MQCRSLLVSSTYRKILLTLSVYNRIVWFFDLSLRGVRRGVSIDISRICMFSCHSDPLLISSISCAGLSHVRSGALAVGWVCVMGWTFLFFAPRMWVLRLRLSNDSRGGYSYSDSRDEDKNKSKDTEKEQEPSSSSSSSKVSDHKKVGGAMWPTVQESPREGEPSCFSAFCCVRGVATS